MLEKLELKCEAGCHVSEKLFEFAKRIDIILEAGELPMAIVYFDVGNLALAAYHVDDKYATEINYGDLRKLPLDVINKAIEVLSKIKEEKENDEDLKNLMEEV